MTYLFKSIFLADQLLNSENFYQINERLNGSYRHAYNCYLWIRLLNIDDKLNNLKILLVVLIVNPESTELFNLNFRSPEVVSRYRDTQLRVTENLCDFGKLSPNIYSCLKIEGIFYFEKRFIQVLIKTQNVNCSRHQCSKG